MRQAEPVFVDSGAWIALALVRDPYHARARETWDRLLGAAARLHTSVPWSWRRSRFSTATPLERPPSPGGGLFERCAA